MDVYVIVLKWLFPKGLVKDRKGNVIQNADPGPRQIIRAVALPSLDEAKKIGRRLWKYNYVNKEKSLVILQATDGFPKWKTVFEHDNKKP